MFYFHKSIKLDGNFFGNVIDPYDVLDLINDMEIVIVLKLLMSSIQLEEKENNDREKVGKMTQKKYSVNVNLIKITPSLLFKCTFVMDHLRKYYYCSFEYLLYTNECYYFRFTLTEAISLRSYSKIYLSYIMFHKGNRNCDGRNDCDNNDNGFKSWLKPNEDYIELNIEILSNKKTLKAVLLVETLGMLAKNSIIVFFENITIILDKLIYSKS